MLAWLWKWLFCYWFHDYYKCYPEVWGRGLDGPWHCGECHPCSEDFLKLLGRKDKYITVEEFMVEAKAKLKEGFQISYKKNGLNYHIEFTKEL